MSDLSGDRAIRTLVSAGALLGIFGVVAGTFAAHVLDKSLDPKSLNTFEVAVRYHMYHALATLCAAWAWTRWPGRLPLFAGWLFVAGTVLFSGSLYLLVATGVKWLGTVAPLGGSAFLIGWLMLALSPFMAKLNPERGA
jgi:uncharacterized membrane protein YgdD (TMEM256/DUF423 family)